MKKYTYNKNNKCIDCRKLITNNAIRCKSCGVLNKWEDRKLNIPKDFLLKEYVKKEKSTYQIAKKLRCSVTPIYRLFRKYNIKIRTRSEACRGKNASNYKDGRTLKKYYCKDCGKNEINYQTAINGQRRCYSCANKGKNSHRIGKRTKPSWGIYKEINMRSSWEVIYAKYLDKHNIIWSYESKVFNLGNTTYTPDFYLPEKDLYIEIKGWWRKKSKKKFDLFRQLYPKVRIKVLMKLELQELGVI